MAEGYFTEAASLMREGGLDPREVYESLIFYVNGSWFNTFNVIYRTEVINIWLWFIVKFDLFLAYNFVPTASVIQLEIFTIKRIGWT